MALEPTSEGDKFELARAYINFKDADPTQDQIQTLAEALADAAPRYGSPEFGPRLYYEITAGPGSLCGRAAVYISVASALVTLLTADYDQGKQRLDKLYASSKIFGNRVVDSILSEDGSHPKFELPNGKIIRQSQTRDVGKLKRLFDKLDAAKGQPLEQVDLDEIRRRMTDILQITDDENSKKRLLDLIKRHPESERIFNTIYSSDEHEILFAEYSSSSEAADTSLDLFEDQPHFRVPGLTKPIESYSTQVGDKRKKVQSVRIILDN